MKSGKNVEYSGLKFIGLKRQRIMYNINLIITTFNRPGMLGDLLSQIVHQKPVKTVIHIHNDGSTEDYFPVIEKYKELLEIRYFVHDHYGKKRYWALINKVFKERAKAKYYIMLPDDDILCDNFFNRVINKWNGIVHPLKICMMPSINVERKWENSWTGVVPVKEGAVYNMGFVDMRFICESLFFEKLGILNGITPKRWERNELASSGVGSQISNTLHRKGYKMFISEEDLTYQVPHKSEMNPNVVDREI